MKLFGSLTSPFVRACRIAAIELDLDSNVEFEAVVVRPTQPNMSYGAAVNPIRRIPALECEDGDVLIDSRVIVEYMNARQGGMLVPTETVDRLRCLNRHAVVAGATEALVSAMYELRVRPEDKQWPAWAEDQISKAQAALDWAEARIDEFAKFDLATIGLVCLIGYGGLRFPHTDWIGARSGIASFWSVARTRSSVVQTTPRE